MVKRVLNFAGLLFFVSLLLMLLFPPAHVSYRSASNYVATGYVITSASELCVKYLEENPSGACDSLEKFVELGFEKPEGFAVTVENEGTKDFRLLFKEDQYGFVGHVGSKGQKHTPKAVNPLTGHAIKFSENMWSLELFFLSLLFLLVSSVVLLGQKIWVSYKGREQEI